MTAAGVIAGQSTTAYRAKQGALADDPISIFILVILNNVVSDCNHAACVRSIAAHAWQASNQYSDGKRNVVALRSHSVIIHTFPALVL